MADGESVSVEKTKEQLRIPWWRGSVFKIYSSHILSSWGDRMWSFALGIYLYYLYPDSLQLTAIYGFTSCISIIIFGAAIGKWIDKTQRLRAAQASLLVQNLSVTLCAGLFIVKLEFAEDIDPIWNGALEIIFIGVIILIGVIADLGSVATKIALEKDWIVVLAAGDENKLASMNSVMRTIDLTTSILSPIIVGQIMTFAGSLYSAIFIAGWNVVSVIVEYYILITLYKNMPSLEKKIEARAPKESECTALVGNEHGRNSSINRSSISMGTVGEPDKKKKKSSMLANLSLKLADTANGWRDYFGHHVRNAGIGLALLYMTVLGFDHITRGYALSQGVSESYLGIFTAVSALFGIFGSLSFPYLRRACGKLITGNIGFGSETLCLALCVVSIFVRGSLFEFGPNKGGGGGGNKTATAGGDGDGQEFYSLAELWNDNISVLLLLTGITIARFGLWVADLSVSQIFQENIAENQRGILNGVQNSLNQGMNLIKFVLVIILPDPVTFGYLVVVSWLAIFLGWIFFMAFSCQREPNIGNSRSDLKNTFSRKVSEIPTISSAVNIGLGADVEKQT